MATTGKRAAAGNQLAFAGFVNSEGILLGDANSEPANGTLAGMFRLLGIQEAQSGILEPDDVNIPGDDDSLGIITFAPDGTPSFIASFGAGDLDFDAAIQQTTKFSVGDTDMVVLQPNDPGYLNMCLIIQSRAIGKDTADEGQAKYDGEYFPLVQAIPLGREAFAGRTAAVYRVKFTTQKAGHLPSGVTITDALAGTSGGPAIEFKGPDPILWDRITGDGSTTEFTLTKAVARTSNIEAIKSNGISNGVVLTHGSGITATANSRTLTFASAPAAGEKVVVWYGFVP